MSSLVADLDTLKNDLLAEPMRIGAHHDLPFAIFRYSPEEEFELRKNLRLLAFGLNQNHGRNIHFISMARLVWEVAREMGGIDDLFTVEAARGFKHAQDHINRLLSKKDFMPLEDVVLRHMEKMDPAKDIVFLVRAGGFAPGIFRCSILLHQMHRQTLVPMVFFYPGSASRATDLNFYDLPGEGALGTYNYRVKVYGVTA